MNRKIFKCVLLVIMSVLSTYAFIYNNKPLVYPVGSTKLFNDLFAVSLILFIVFFFLFNKYYFKKRTHNKLMISLSFLFSLFMIFGDSFEAIGSTKLIFGNVLNLSVALVTFIGYFIFFVAIINITYELLSNKKIDYRKSNNKYITAIFEKHSIIYPIVIILICWLPYIISFYPVILSADPANQIKQFYGLKTRYIYGVKLLDENVLITNDNPVLHTVLLGGSVKIGETLFNSHNVGLFIYSIIQITLLLLALSSTIHYMKKIDIPYSIRIIVLTIYSLVPVFPFYAMDCNKDIIYTCFIILYTIQLFDLIKNKKKDISNKKRLLVILLSVLIIFTRNNGLYLILLSLPFLLFIYSENNRKKIMTMIIFPVILYLTAVNLIFPALKIIPGNKREMLSIPFQQTARYVKYHEEELTDKEKEIIDKILGYDTLASRYVPTLADQVKNNYNAYSTKKDRVEYFKVWLNGLKKHPGTYIEATLNNIYGYFYPNTSSWYFYYKRSTKLDNRGIDFNYHYNNLDGSRKILSTYGLVFPKIPGIGLILNIGINTWLIFMMIVFLIKQKAKEYLIILSPAISTILMCIASPANTYFRYVLPYVFSMPLLIVFILYIFRNTNNDEYSK